MNKFKVIDLFAGAGGLSLGFEQTNKFKVKVAIEKNSNAKTTYKKNFPEVDLYDDILNVDFREFNGRYGGIDVVIGGPPCQGFSNANRQHNQAINLNNKLVKEYIRAILQIRPKAFVMENVGMLKSDVHRFYIEQDDVSKVDKYKIPTRNDHIFLLDEKWKFEGVTELLANEADVKGSRWSDRLFKDINVIYKNRNNLTKMRKAIEGHLKAIQKAINNTPIIKNEYVREKSVAAFKLFERYSDDVSLEKIICVIEEPLALQKMLIRAEEIYSNGIILEAFDISKDIVAEVKSCAVYDYLTCILGANGNGYAISNGILSAEEFGIPQKRKRFIIIGIKKQYTDFVELPTPSSSVAMTNVFDALSDLKTADVHYSVEEDDERGGVVIPEKFLLKTGKLSGLRDSNGAIYNHVVPKTRETALKRFQAIKPGENFHALPKEMKENTYTNVERTQNTVYLRLNYKEPSGTVINVRKSMWIHPELDRAVSIREAARLQTFPDSFRFFGPKDAEYQQVGNAVPPMLARTIAEKILTYIDGH